MDKRTFLEGCFVLTASFLGAIFLNGPNSPETAAIKQVGFAVTM